MKGVKQEQRQKIVATKFTRNTGVFYLSNLWSAVFLRQLYTQLNRKRYKTSDNQDFFSCLGARTRGCLLGVVRKASVGRQPATLGEVLGNYEQLLYLGTVCVIGFLQAY